MKERRFGGVGISASALFPKITVKLYGSKGFLTIFCPRNGTKSVQQLHPSASNGIAALKGESSISVELSTTLSQRTQDLLSDTW